MSEISLKLLQEICSLVTTTSSDGQFRIEDMSDGTSVLYIESASKTISTAIRLDSSRLGSLRDDRASVASLKQCIGLLAGTNHSSRATLCARDGDTLVLTCNDLDKGVETVFEVPLLDNGDTPIAIATYLNAPSTLVSATTTFHTCLLRYVLSRRDPVLVEIRAGDGVSSLRSIPEPGSSGVLGGESMLAGAVCGERRSARFSLNERHMAILAGETRGRVTSTVLLTDESLVIQSETENMRIRHSFASSCEL